MRTRSSSNLVGESYPNPTTSNPKRRNRRRSKQPFSLEESPVVTMADQRTMAELLRAPTEGYAEAIVVPLILAQSISESKHGQPIVGSKKNPLVLFSLGKILFPNSSMNSFLPQERQISEMKFPTLNNVLVNRFMRHGTVTKISFVLALIMVLPNCTNLIPFSQGLKPKSEQEFFEFCAGVYSFGEKYQRSKLTHAVNQQTSALTTAMTAILKQFQATPPPASVKAVEEICVTCGGAHPYYQCLAAYGNTFRDNIQRYVSAAAVNYNKAITIRSGLVRDGPFVPMPPPFINPEEDERVEETLTDPNLTEFTIKVPPPLVKKAKPPSQRNYVVHQRDPRYPNIPYPLRMNQEK
ncbi:hypothetical protein Tco_0693521 [Tanacetum coccineum]